MQIYFASCPSAELVKIGTSSNVLSRMRQLKAHIGAPVELIGVVAGNRSTEQSIHNALKQYRHDGEWYQDCQVVRAAIQNCFNNFQRVEPITEPRQPPVFGRVCKAIWPTKTAEQLAAAVGCSVRAAAYEISGEREPSAKSLAVVFNKMVYGHQR